VWKIVVNRPTVVKAVASWGGGHAAITALNFRKFFCLFVLRSSTEKNVRRFLLYHKHCMYEPYCIFTAALSHFSLRMRKPHQYIRVGAA